MSIKILMLCIVLTGVAVTDPATAANHRDRPRTQSGESRDSTQRVSLDQAVDIVRSRYEGTVLSASTATRNGRPVHYVRILDDKGRVRTIKVDGVTGQIL